MKAKIKIEKEIDIKNVLIELPVRYDDEDIPYDFPLRVGDDWKAVIEIDTGRIVGWPKGETGNMHIKVCDEGNYYLIDDTGATIASIEEDYVPNKLLPPVDGYGDYVHFIINEDGIITNWYKNPKISQFFNKE